nr:MAG TPA: hypothetical protein [Inoviridae sp.]
MSPILRHIKIPLPRITEVRGFFFNEPTGVRTRDT